MILYPALDLRNGKVVRLVLGDPAQETIYDDDPLAAADRWIAAGATWLHVVNLDGAFATANQNESIVKQLAGRGVPIQFGGGMRRLDDIERALTLGVTRVVIGTLAAQQPEIIRTVIERHGPQSVAVGLDARNGLITTHGWQQVTNITPAELGKKAAAMGVQHALYTDVSRDGALSGVNVAGTAELARTTGLQVIASGGVSSLDDLMALHDSHAVAGAILGTALYKGMIELTEALQRVKDS